VASEKHLLVDGSNILHAWPEMRSLEKRDRDAARARLSEKIRLLHDFEKYRVTLVFDGRGTETVVEHPSGESSFTHIFTPSHLTADDVIEHLVAQSSNPSECQVATDDRAERQTVEASGGASMSANDLLEWIARAENRQRAKVSGLERRNDQEWRK
jgi:uncharacterized protein